VVDLAEVSRGHSTGGDVMEPGMAEHQVSGPLHGS
jgi:hypothetical protein